MTVTAIQRNVPAVTWWPLPVVSDLLAVATDAGWSGEGLALWLYTRTGYLEDEARPVEHLADDPQAVLAAPRKDVQPRW